MRGSKSQIIFISNDILWPFPGYLYFFLQLTVSLWGKDYTCLVPCFITAHTQHHSLIHYR